MKKKTKESRFLFYLFIFIMDQIIQFLKHARNLAEFFLLQSDVK